MLQFFIILAALVPLVVVALIDVGGIGGLADRIRETELGESRRPGRMNEWRFSPLAPRVME